MDVDAKQGAFGRDAEGSPLLDPRPAASPWRKRSVPEGAGGRSGGGHDAERKMHQAAEERGSWARNASGGCWVFLLSTDFEGKGALSRVGGVVSSRSSFRHVGCMSQVVWSTYRLRDVVRMPPVEPVQDHEACRLCVSGGTN